MSISAQYQVLFNGIIHAFKEISPKQVTIQSPSSFTAPNMHLEYSVLIDVIGDVKARMIIDSNHNSFQKLCESLYGFQIDGELLESFVGEFGNMVAGKLCIYSAEHNIQLDITTPTVMVSETHLPISTQTFTLPISMDEIGHVTMLLSIEAS
ncbi:chemotaxis protein CheX [Kurthia gibsonii]|uniref:chemotaxis protein CheX n=1 Tax=Kurthia gibsonii TaxID=33946 RepID=UPI0011433D50|nr:chemotaxis protein CheX [Kurthia gibsonii]GED20714.1 hypothetical protein KGI01_24550 [Kurthia gibsonii]